MINWLLLYWDQVLVVVTGAPAIALSQMTDVKYRQWAPMLGIAGQLGWFHATLQAEQYGLFVMTFLYTAAWMLGIYNLWIKPVRGF